MSVSHALKNNSLLDPIKNEKVASKIELLPYKNKINSIFGKYGFERYNRHIKAAEIKNNISTKIWNNFFKFGFVRNPWGWQVSLYHYMLENKDHFQHKIIKNKNFNEYIYWRIKQDLHLQKDFFFLKIKQIFQGK